MKLAHLILTHSNPSQLQRLVSRLQHDNADVFIHVDKKTPIEPFLSIADLPNVYFVKNTIKVFWGGYSIVQATVNSFEEILMSRKAYDYINLISGQDYPIKSTDFIHEYLSDNPGKVFMHYASLTEEWHEAIPRITQYHLINYNLPIATHRLEKIINSILPERKLPEGFTAMGRSQWFTASTESVAYLVAYIKEKDWISKFFKLTWAPDEIIFQTILYNSPFRDKMINDNLVYIDWANGGASPKTLNMEDADTLQKSDKLFARKFNMHVDSDILDFLDKLCSHKM